MELARDGQWVAQRVGPDEIVDAGQLLPDPGGGLRRSATASCARPRWWTTPASGAGTEDGPFDFAAVYGDPGNQGDAYNLDRHRAFESGCLDLETVGVRDLMRFLREVYEGTAALQDPARRLSLPHRRADDRSHEHRGERVSSSCVRDCRRASGTGCGAACRPR